VKRQRQQTLVDLVRREPLASQEEIRSRLARAGHPATQSTISRDIEELGLVRVRDRAGGLRYAAPEAAHPVVSLETLLREFVVSVESSANVVVVKTLPGAAQAVAEGMDRAGLDDVLGTVAGDDTIFLAIREGVKGRTAAKRLRTIAGLS
jgi:transcriptional regulator of arginine metabolism